VFNAGYNFLTLETTVRILDGDDAPQLNLRLFRHMQNRPVGPLNWFGQELDTEAFLQRMIAEKRLIYEINITHSYGMV
jgi:hypothetical protein